MNIYKEGHSWYVATNEESMVLDDKPRVAVGKLKRYPGWTRRMIRLDIDNDSVIVSICQDDETGRIYEYFW